MVVSSDPDVELSCIGLGSCVAVVAYGPRQGVGAMAHVVLPDPQGRDVAKPAHYATTAVPCMVTEFTRRGIRPEDMRLAICGGAAVFALSSDLLNIGQRNVEAVRAALAQAGLKVVCEEVLGKDSRTVTLNLRSGIVRLRTVRTGEYVLARLSGDDDPFRGLRPLSRP